MTKKLQIIGNLGNNKLFTQNEEPIDAPEGALWLDLDEAAQTLSGGIQADWNQTDPTAVDYIRNKPDMQDGQDGVGIQSIEQTTISDQDGGDNILTFTLTNGQKAEFTVKNGSKGGGADTQSDWNQIDENADGYIKNKPFYYGEIYVENLALPTDHELYCTTMTDPEYDVGYALLGYKTIFEVGRAYTFEQTTISGSAVYTSSFSLTAYPASALGFHGLDGVMVLVDSDSMPYIISGAILDLSTFPNIDPSTIIKTDDTMYICITPNISDLHITLTCKEYNNLARGYKTIDMNYLPIDQICEHIVLPDDSISSIQLKTGSVTGDKIAHETITADHIKKYTITADQLANNAVTDTRIADSAVSKEKIANRAVTGDKIARLAVTTDKIASNAVTKDKIANGSIPYSKLQDYECSGVVVTSQDVVFMNYTNACATMEPKEGIYVLEIMSTDTVSTSQQIVINLICEVSNNGVISKRDIEIFRENFDCSESKKIIIEIHLLKFANNYFAGEVRTSKGVTPIMTFNVPDYNISLIVGLPALRVEFNDSINQQIASGSKIWFVKQQDNWVKDTEVIDDDV